MTPVWLVLPDPFSSRLFFDTGIVEDLHARLGDRLELFLLDTGEQSEAWRERAGAIRTTRPIDLASRRPRIAERAARRADAWADRRIGFYPLSLRHSLRHGFHRQRMRPGHPNWFLDPNLAGPLPRWGFLEPAMRSWHYGRLRYVPPPLLGRMRAERPAVALANMQMHSVVPFIVGARCLRLPAVGNIASWDHTVGKGIVAPHLARYLVQNEVMRNDLESELKGLRKAIWPLTILMNFNIWAYVWLAWAKPDPASPHGFAMIAFVYAVNGPGLFGTFGTRSIENTTSSAVSSLPS